MKRLQIQSLFMDIEFIKNIAGSRIASSLELERGYTPSISGFSPINSDTDLTQAHK